MFIFVIKYINNSSLIDVLETHPNHFNIYDMDQIKWIHWTIKVDNSPEDLQNVKNFLDELVKNGLIVKWCLDEPALSLA